MANCRDQRFGPHKNFELNLEHNQSFEDLTKFINATIDAKRRNINSSIVKHMSIADSCVGPEFLAQVKQHYHLHYNEPKMNQEKFQYVMTTKMDPPQKIKWLELWNSSSAFQMASKFPKMFIFNKVFDIWLHKIIF